MAPSVLRHPLVGSYLDGGHPAYRPFGARRHPLHTAMQPVSGFEAVAVGTRWGGTQYNFRENDLGSAPFGVMLSLAGASRAERVAPEHFRGYEWR